jgi:hypothetical protein
VTSLLDRATPAPGNELTDLLGSNLQALGSRAQASVRCRSSRIASDADHSSVLEVGLPDGGGWVASANGWCGGVLTSRPSSDVWLCDI